jgi:hypothetical protein
MSIIPIIFLALLFGLGPLFGTGGSVTREAVPEPSAAASPVSPAYGSDLTLSPKLVRAMFENRQVLPTCESWDCLQDAAGQQGNGAELALTVTTVEGDPITTYFRVKPGGEYEIFTDNTQDAFRGDPAWTYDVCPIPADVRAGCTGS